MTVEIKLVPISEIYVEAERQRPTTPGAVKEFKHYLNDHNMLNGNPIRLTPIKVPTPDGTMKYQLIFGAHRLAAAKELGLTEIPATFCESTDPKVWAKEQFLENFNRNELGPEKEKLIFEFMRDNPHMRQQDVGVIVGSQPKVSKAIIAYEYRQEYPERAGNKPTNTVYKMAQENKRRQAVAFTLGVPPLEDTVLTGDAVEWMERYSGPPFNLIHCDFPYGIDAHKHAGQNARIKPQYSDTPKVANRLFDGFVDNLNKFCAEDAHILFWFSPDHYCEVWHKLKQLDGFTFLTHPLIWARGSEDSDRPNQGISPDSDRRPRQVYETAFFGWRGKAKILKQKNNLKVAPVERTIHEHAKSLGALYYFLDMVVDETTRLFDPTCGSGSALLVAKTLGAAHVFGIELDPINAQSARQSLAASEDIEEISLEEVGLE